MKRLRTSLLGAILGLGLASALAAQGLQLNFNSASPTGACSLTPFTQASAGNQVWTANCSGTLTISAWGPAGGGSGTSSSTAPGGGGGAFASGSVNVTNGTTWNVVAGAGGAGAANVGGSGSRPSYFCPTSVAACTTTMTSCSGVGLSSSNFVCADFGLAATSGSPSGGLAASSVGSRMTFSGSSGTPGTGSCPAGLACGGNAGAAGGPDGAATAAVAPTGLVRGSGGAGDNNIGGAGGTNNSGSTGGPGGTDTAHGGGGAGGNGGAGSGGAGGCPGGAGGGSWNGTGGSGCDGRIVGS